MTNPKTTVAAAEARALAGQRADLMAGLHAVAGLLAMHPDLAVPETVSVEWSGWDWGEENNCVCVQLTLPRTPDEQACRAMLTGWEAAVGPIVFRELYTELAGRTGHFGTGRCGRIAVKIIAFHSVASPPGADVSGQADGRTPADESREAALALAEAEDEQPETDSVVAHQAPGPAGPAEPALRLAYWALVWQRPEEEWVGLAALRSYLGDRFARAEVDQALAAIAKSPGCHLIPVANSKGLTRADRDAALVLGGEPCHALMIERAAAGVSA